MAYVNYTTVVAIDFGTTRSGYELYLINSSYLRTQSYHFAFTDRPKDIYPNSKWIGALPEGKTLTEILLRPDFSVVAFGYEARTKFANIKDKDEYLYFSNFKMVLHDNEGIIRSKVKATNCDTYIPTETLVAICLRVIKDKAVNQLNTAKTVQIALERIRWVITVPAIWDIPARQAMLNAAEKAGMPLEHVIIALEPEAAVLNCIDSETILRRIAAESSSDDANKSKKENLPLVDNDFMVVDAGGGTVDITVHRNRSEGGLVELHPPSGGAWGAFFINKQFEILLEELFGETDMRNTLAWYQIMDTFEGAKTNFSPEDPVGSVCVSPVNSKETVGESLINALEAYNKRHGTELQIGRGQMLDFSSFLKKQLDQQTDNIIAHITSLFAKPALQHIQYLFLVGGFAESITLRSKMEEQFGSRVKVIIPPNPGVSVVRGAVYYGFDPSIIKERIVQQSIGIQHSGLWDDAKHVGRRQIIGDKGQRYCNELVHCFIHANEKIPVGYQVVQMCAPTTAQQTKLRVQLYASANEAISFTSDEGTYLLGYLDLEIPDQGVYQRVVEVTLLFGGSTIIAQATYKKTGQSVKAKFDFNLDNIPVLVQNMNL